jgi:hypothetical protein
MPLHPRRGTRLAASDEENRTTITTKSLAGAKKASASASANVTTTTTEVIATETGIETGSGSGRTESEETVIHPRREKSAGKAKTANHAGAIASAPLPSVTESLQHRAAWKAQGPESQ